MTSRRIFLFSFLAAVGFVASAAAQLPELEDVDVTNWDCVDSLEGSAKTQDGKERNRQKNRSPVEITNLTVLALDTPGFLRRVAGYDGQTQLKHRRPMTSDQKQQLETWEKQIVSLTGWLVLAYRGVPETTNCRSEQFLDMHLELFERPTEHAPQIGDPTPIICEITPRTEALLYRANIRIQKLAAFFRLPDSSFQSTGEKAHKIRVTGCLLWDDDHNGPADVGSTIQWTTNEGYHHPWRSTAWEIHPVLKIEDLGTK
jgi:hypothetical protein